MQQMVNIFYQHIVHVDWGIVYNPLIIFVFVMFIFRPIFRHLSDSSCISCDFPVLTNYVISKAEIVEKFSVYLSRPRSPSLTF